VVRKVAFVFLVLLFTVAGGLGGYFLWQQAYFVPAVNMGLAVLLVFFGFSIGLVLAPRLIDFTVWAATRVEQYLQKVPVADLVSGTVGLILGLIIANLFGSVLASFGWVGRGVWIVVTAFLGYLGLSIGVKKREEVVSLFTGIKFGKEKTPRGEAKVLDTSAIIDGRIADLCASGFLEGTLVVPAFVLEELQRIADSNDILKRNRGRRGLDVLNEIRRRAEIKVQIYESSKGLEEAADVDAKLVRLAKKLGGKIITTDFNLNKVAELQGVKVLNINELANALKPVVLPGEEMVVTVIKDGKEAGQGVGYLDDGTMIVIDGGKKHIGQTIKVLVTSVLQTTAGRMIFAKPKVVKRDGASRLNGVNVIG